MEESIYENSRFLAESRSADYNEYENTDEDYYMNNVEETPVTKKNKGTMITGMHRSFITS